jgi:hypothetical protein
MNINGIGLGLVISENIVKQFNGEISFESEPRVGSTFTFTFLLDEDDTALLDNLSLNNNREKYMLNANELMFEWRPKKQVPDPNCLIQKSCSNDKAPKICYINGLDRKFQGSEDSLSSVKSGRASVQMESLNSINQSLIQSEQIELIKPNEFGMVALPEDQGSQISHGMGHLPSSKRILLVDDQGFNLDALVIILKYSIGLDSTRICDKAKNGLEALQRVRENVE